MCEHLQYGGFKTPFIFVGSCVLLFALPCTLLVKAKSESIMAIIIVKARLITFYIAVDSKSKHTPFKIFSKTLTNLVFVLLGTY